MRIREYDGCDVCFKHVGEYFGPVFGREACGFGLSMSLIVAVSASVSNNTVLPMTASVMIAVGIIPFSDTAVIVDSPVPAHADPLVKPILSCEFGEPLVLDEEFADLSLLADGPVRKTGVDQACADDFDVSVAEKLEALVGLWGREVLVSSGCGCGSDDCG